MSKKKKTYKPWTADQIIESLEASGLGWSLDHCGTLIEARIWKWPHVVGRYRPEQVEPLAKMLGEAINDMNEMARHMAEVDKNIAQIVSSVNGRTIR